MENLFTIIKKYSTIIIHRHANPDGDALASQFGLAKLIKKNYKNKKVYTVGGKIPKYLSTLFPSNDLLKDDLYKDALVIVVDTANSERIEDNRWKLGKEIYKIDHHVNIEKYAKYEIVDDKKASCAELITKLATENNLKFDKDISTALLVGIITDTGRFFYNSTSSSTFEAAEKLMSKGANLENIYSSLYKRDIKSIRFSGYVSSKYKIKKNISYIILKKRIEKKYKLDYQDISSMVNLITGADITKYSLYASYDLENKVYKISLRSKAKPINKIAEKYNGGGHKFASGAKAKSKKEIKKMIGELEKL